MINMIEEKLTLTAGEFVKVVNDVTDFGEPILVPVIDPVTGLVVGWVWEIPPHWDEIIGPKVRKLTIDTLPDDIEVSTEALIKDPACRDALVPIGVQFARLAEHSAVVDRIEAQTLFRDASARLVLAGLGSSVRVGELS